MDNEIRLAIVKFAEKAKKAYMFEYCKHTYLNEGDTVIVLDSAGNESEATVVDTVTFNLKYESDKDELNRLLMVAGVEMPFRKVVGKVKRTYFKYEDEVSADENDD